MKNEIKFYSVQVKTDSEGNIKTELRIRYKEFIDLLLSFGFRRYDIGKASIYIRITDNVVTEYSITQIQDYFLNYIKSLPEKLEDNVRRDSLLEKFYSNPANYFCDRKLNLLMCDKSLEFNTDTRDSVFLYFKNGYVKVTQEGYNLYDYASLNKCIWANQILPRDFEKKEFIESQNAEFAKFCFNVSGKKLDRFHALMSIIGYNLHTYFDTKLKASIFTDSKISETPSGRTGKTLFCKGLGKIKNYCEINGKDFDPTYRHKYQEVEVDTQIVCLNDVRSPFDFELLYNDITEYLPVQRKNQQPFRIKAKMLITTNKTIQTTGDSSKDRCIEFEFSEHYHRGYSPQDEFGHRFFTEWDKSEWNLYDNFMMSSISFYFKKGLVEPKPINLNIRKVIEQTSFEFVEYVNSCLEEGFIESGKEYPKSTIYNHFKELYEIPNERHFYSDVRNFYKHLKTYCECSDYHLEYSERTSNSIRWFSIIDRGIKK
ncbi:hypothetical protein M2459_002165 [Parabacteroides sp. PF5-5]|uniref:primase-helicase family protein n=1 Tax=unclassified Parabacteroides TaxID=2649774 RepID=UPI0024739ACD|nr:MULTISPECIES: primase-helicase family protein [unclassified Parabacteroides]MDH6306819.1 hypothetical protein [Parabacteroides sp. PH5-39]MDH6316264.1 hypothetical protein [Parabacteroides sp. PF5-13]MDH6319747.1 hypothetical protein [Parabacteroides sp. PH5-13]MDH6323661.1 hypothetical protein [Parabacteroides sp. PH5-8]MDH6327451.1 hypothetical protein [Parabacteroides sp. PH5-41]